MNRRVFLELSASTGMLAMLNAHGSLAATGSSVKKKISSRVPRIKALRLLTIAPFPEMKKFYSETIGLSVLEKPGELIVQAGESVITFLRSEEKNKRPFYHFAFNIPENKIQEAFEWQRKKTPIIHPNPAGPVNQVVNFAHWNAHSIFFLDPAGNLLEYIARHDLPNAGTGVFSAKDILYVSEIGFIVEDTITTGKSLQKELAITQYRDPTDGFWPIGDEMGLLLMIRKGRVWTGHPDQPNQTDIFKTSVILQSAIRKNWEMNGYPYDISFA